MGRMMGMGDMIDAMDNMNNMMTEPDPANPGEYRQKAGGDVMKMMGSMRAMGMDAKAKAVAHGRDLFNDPEFASGSKGQSCGSCHPNGGTTGGIAETPMPLRDGNPARLPIPPLHGVAAAFPKFKVPNNSVVMLSTMSNNCVRMFMGGKRLDANEQDMRDLIAYLGTLKKS